MGPKAAKVATELLKELGIQDMPVDVRAIAEAKGVRVVAGDLDEDTSGVIVIKNDQAIIGVNRTHHPNRQRFSIAHELGHYLLHRDYAHVFVDTVHAFFRDGNSTKGTDTQEIEANAFAAELLMPKDIVVRYVRENRVDVHDEMYVRRLALKFGVSEQALTIRLTRLGLVFA